MVPDMKLLHDLGIGSAGIQEPADGSLPDGREGQQAHLRPAFPGGQLCPQHIGLQRASTACSLLRVWSCASTIFLQEAGSEMA